MEIAPTRWSLGVGACTLQDMDQDPLRTTLDTLRHERHGAELRASELQDELTDVAQRLTHLRGAIENIEALLGEPSEDDAAVLRDDNEEVFHAEAQDLDFIYTPDQPPRLVNDPFEPPPIRKRVPSTDWVAEVVNAIGRPADRDTIYQKFEELKGIPDSWNANPRNSFNNALGRAVERHLIGKFGDLFGPRGYNLSETSSSASEES
ncbi:hypothetical protein [Microbacterium pumilum]|uniref:HTH HARE-type domain-containing protein n=1 Tax=Microbacterium pumilum TaxID=344165 RepID=A0ABP5EJ65_9MICO